MNEALQPRPLVLYVENNPDDMFFLERQVKRSRVNFDLHGVSDVSAALNFLCRCEPCSPEALLLDYTLDGGGTGLDLLRSLRQKRGLRNLVTIMYSSGELPEIVAACYQEGANYFIHKSPNMERIREFVRCLDDCLARKPYSFEPLTRLREYTRPVAHPIAPATPSSPMLNGPT